MLVAKGNLLEDFNQLASNYRAVSHELTLAEWNERMSMFEEPNIHSGSRPRTSHRLRLKKIQ